MRETISTSSPSSPGRRHRPPRRRRARAIPPLLPAQLHPRLRAPRLVRSFRHAFSGFAARLTPVEAAAVKVVDGVVSVQENRITPLGTTYTPTFLGLNGYNGIWYKTKGEGVIIGVLDTGISRNHVSFADDKMPPPLRSGAAAASLSPASATPLCRRCAVTSSSVHGS
uniref:Inhibitor I9 domain-containing protein n=1 Tax=Ananas comosus var. bracteatus TaxID=296719 RepID=A0A6V7PUD9_ANACO|nr:unnamed protein product [Ananas comosus var. bracteatus]